MKTCTISGNMNSDRTSENYPTAPVCDECVAKSEAQTDESAIVLVGAFDPTFGTVCAFCEKTLEEEETEHAP